ncbi:MAG: ArsA-related P-loop ATPase [Pseudomonadota bacterium]
MKVSYLDEILSKKVVFFTGKGGVGKSAVASASALFGQRHGKTVYLVSWNPFDQQARPLPYHNLGIPHLLLNGTECFREYAMGILKFEKIVNLIIDNKVVNTFISVAPGLSETVIAGKIWDLSDKNPNALILVDLPASGHALSFFSSPLGLRRLFKMGLVHREIERICEMMLSPTTAIQLVSLPEELPVTETLELKKKLLLLGNFHFNAIFLNQCLPAFPGTPFTDQEAQSQLEGKSFELFHQYTALQQQESDALSVLNQTGLSVRKIPRLSCPEWITTVEAISEILEHS